MAFWQDLGLNPDDVAALQEEDPRRFMDYATALAALSRERARQANRR